MLFRSLTALLAGGLAIDAALALETPGQSGSAVTRREVPASHILHERQMPHWSRAWTRTKRMVSTAVLPMRIGLKQPNLALGHDLLMDRQVTINGSLPGITADLLLSLTGPTQSPPISASE